MLEEKFIIQILKDHINGHITKLPDDLDLNRIVDYAKKHNLEGIVYNQIKIEKLYNNYLATVYTYVNRKKSLSTIGNLFKEKKIEYFLVKGFSVAELYPVPSLRTMGDCDIIIHSKDKEQVHEIMMELKFICEGKGEQEWKYSLNNIQFEIHDHLMYEEDRNSEKAVKYFDSAWDYVCDNSLEWEFHFIFLLYHLRKHIIGQGAGLRQFLDLAIVINKIDLDWQRLLKTIEYLNLSKFFNRVLSLLISWFDIDIPLLNLEIDYEFVENITHKILNDGVFGFANAENRNNIFMASVCKHGKRYALKSFLQDIFIPYKEMADMDEYKFLKGKIILLPIAWIYRIIIKWNNRKKIKEKYLISDKKINNRIDYLNQWGL